MTEKKSTLYSLLQAITLLLSIFLVACGGGNNTEKAPVIKLLSSAATSSARESASSSIAVTISSLNSSTPSSDGDTVQIIIRDSGTYVVATGVKAGFSLYTFDNDKSGASTCYGNCAATWPPYTIANLASLKAPAGVSLGVVTRTDGSLQVTLNNEPLYFYSNDVTLDGVTGQGMGFVWWLADLTSHSSSSGNSSVNSPASSLSVTASSSSKSSAVASSSAAKTTPNPLIFTALTSANKQTEYISNKVTITGINTSIPISVASGEYSINNSAFTNISGSAVNGDTIELKVVTSNREGEPHHVTFKAGDIIADWTLTNIGTFNLGYTRDLIDSFGSLDGWSNISGSAAGSQNLLTQQGPNGENVIRLGVDKANTKRGISKTIIPKDYTKGWFGQWVRFPNLNLSKTLVDSFWRDPFSSNGYYQRVWSPNANIKTDESTVASGDWEFIMWQGNEMAASGKQSDGITPTPVFDANTVWFNKIYVQNIATGNNAAIDFGPLYANIRQDKAKLLITFDDSNETDYTEAFAYLKPLGIKATTYTIPNLIGSNPGFLTIAELQELQAAGWTIGSHHELNLAKLTPEKLLTSLTETKEWMIANGFTSWPHFAFPEGAFNPKIISQMKALGYQSGRTVINRYYPLIPENSLFHLGGDGTSRWKTAAEGMADIDTAIASGGTIFLFTHRLEPTTGSLEHTNIDIWKTVVNYAIAKRDAEQLDILTMDELYEIASKQPGRQQ